MIEMLPLVYNIRELQTDLDKVVHLIDQRNQVCVNAPANEPENLYGNIGGTRGTKEPVCSYINAPFRDTVFEKILSDLPAPIGRARIMRLTPHHCYSFHYDQTPRFHVVLKTNPRAYMIFDDLKAHHLPADGHVYFTDTRQPHSAFNAGTEDRYHLVVVQISADLKTGVHWTD